MRLEAYTRRLAACGQPGDTRLLSPACHTPILPPWSSIQRHPTRLAHSTLTLIHKQGGRCGIPLCDVRYHAAMRCPHSTAIQHKPI